MLNQDRANSPSRPHTEQAETASIIPRDQHPISRKQISQAALNIMYDLNRAGYEAYLVGGCIRDLLLGNTPKDFDVATNATPEQVHALFRRSRIVGRRFRIVHVRVGPEVIEVTTFRGAHTNEPTGKNANSHANEQGMLLRDNVYGNMRDDALRRDFTVNALYYTVDGFHLVDYTTGLDDLRTGTLRIIGEPEQRYREDPVRMLRAMRFAAKLGFELAPTTAKPIRQLGSLLSSVSPARLFDEAAKLFLTGHGKATFNQLREFELLKPLLGRAAHPLLDPQSALSKLVTAVLENTDLRIANEQSVTPSFLFASFLWQRYQDLTHSLENESTPFWRASQLAGLNAIEEIQTHISIPRRFSLMIRDIWQLQHSLETANGKRAIRLLGHNRFRAAYDFLLMRETTGEPLKRGAEYWTDLQKKHADKVHSPSSRQKKPQRYQHNRSTSRPQSKH